MNRRPKAAKNQLTFATASYTKLDLDFLNINESCLCIESPKRFKKSFTL